VAEASRATLDVALAQPVLSAGAAQTTYLKVGLTGAKISAGERAAVNLAIVLDRSGSMQGEKLTRAKQAAMMAIDRLSDHDIVSVVAYDDTIRVLVPATRVSDRAAIHAAIERLEAGGSTALFAGVSKGASEVRKFLDRQRANRVILLSDGLANVGPDSPAELGALGVSLAKEGIAVTTIGLGLGYNEDLMSRLAGMSDGNHAFVEHPRDLARIFDYELGDVLSVVAQEIVITIRCPNGVRPVRVLGRQAEIIGNTVVLHLNQLYSEHEKYLLLELEVPAGSAGERRALAAVTATYSNMSTRRTDELEGLAAARYSDRPEAVSSAENGEVMVAVVEQIATEQNELALALRDKGRIEEARSVLQENTFFLESNAMQLDSIQLQELAESNKQDAEQLEGEEWEATRKRMREHQAKTKTQRKW
jgi:Ca-activated chloride channel family protein